jgi:hypothetical protein
MCLASGQWQKKKKRRLTREQQLAVLGAPGHACHWILCCQWTRRSHACARMHPGRHKGRDTDTTTDADADTDTDAHMHSHTHTHKLSPPPPHTHTPTHSRTHAHTHARTHTPTHSRTHRCRDPKTCTTHRVGIVALGLCECVLVPQLDGAVGAGGCEPVWLRWMLAKGHRRDSLACPMAHHGAQHPRTWAGDVHKDDQVVGAVSKRGVVAAAAADRRAEPIWSRRQRPQRSRCAHPLAIWKYTLGSALRLAARCFCAQRDREKGRLNCRLDYLVRSRARIF